MDLESGSGTLVLAATPLGDARDASARLIDALGSAAIIAAEDTRRVRALATSLGVSPSGKIVSYYEDVEAARTPRLLEALRDGRDVLLVTDAGMPSVSDPGYRLVSACAADGLAVTCLPGPSAVTTALAVSGLASDRFCFEGFPPRKSGERRRWFGRLVAEQRTCVFFESPRRLGDTLADAVEVLGADRAAVVCRELTKTYEEVRRGDLGSLAEWATGEVRGEITVVVAGAVPVSQDPADLVPQVEERAADGMRLKDAVAEVAELSGARKNDLYTAVLASRQ
ncbi:16S rRNA (cytidine(1402)-2'-O)-methyltransferase [Saccharopolyspora gloriosae]|uniref:Ribosomal RNA small subunit methyltransferase I n=1 Tax=Saccharopolyspora gloriosae TaxID=455344 RepID=A0A840N5G6_9PSEU|nr:16S rRNA (cytidine(1402)-2'-O)-methyltransferase [Saccharopolyspora gloriosae]MBB5067256.1 16S rRNA (cytidine1402-2'-O)-methyltransferase [Saccharopolyspora gloriosae]